MKNLCLCILLVAASIVSGQAQTSLVVPWHDFPEQRAYEPMPVVCVHGIASDSVETWSYGVSLLGNYFSTTYFYSGDSSPALTPQFEGQPSTKYVETFDYGVYSQPGTTNTLGHLQTFDSIKSNAWEGVYQKSINGSITLSNRIAQVREAYQLGDGSFPPVTLLCHSMGGVLAHYYLTRCAQTGTDPGVSRVITFGTPHYGSTLANWQRQTYGPGGWMGTITRPLKRLTVEHALQYEFSLAFNAPDLANFANYANPPGGDPEKAGMTDISYNVPYAGAVVGWLQNPLIPYFQSNAVPGTVEYVANSFTILNSGSLAAIGLGLAAVRLLDSGGFDYELFGDGVVPGFSQEGRSLPGAQPDIYDGNSSDGNPIRPVILSGWNSFHEGESKVSQAILASLSGVPYQYGLVENYQSGTPLLPSYAGSPGDTNSFSKYLPTRDGTITHSDEPGIAQMTLCYSSSSSTNPLVIPAMNSWGIGNNVPQLLYTNQASFAGAQIVGLGTGSDLDEGHVSAYGLIGTKNHSTNTLEQSGTNYWAGAGNEYLPASLGLNFAQDVNPVSDVITRTGGVTFTNAVSQSLVEITATDNTNQYGYFIAPASSISLVYAGNNFVAAQGENVAGLLTPQAQQEFNVVVDSATVVGILQKINQGEALSNTCHNATPLTQWTTTVSEWVNSNTGSITLDFFPTSSPPNVYDAWTRTAYSSGN